MIKKSLAILFSTMAITANCQEILTIGGVFDFNIQDVFHITNLYGLPNGYKSTITDKWYSADQDTVYYAVTIDKYSSQYNSQTEELDYNYNSSSEVLSYFNLESSIYNLNNLTRYPEDSTLVFSYDSLIYIDTTLCNVQINGFSRSDGDFEPRYSHREYGKGLGLTYQKDITAWHGEPDWEYKLVYYVKDGVECGIPDWHLNKVTTNDFNNLRFEIYPTNVKDKIFINDSNPTIPYEIRLIDISGRIQIEMSNLFGNYSLNLEGIVSGVYVVVIQSDKLTVTERIIKE